MVYVKRIYGARVGRRGLIVGLDSFLSKSYD